MKIGNCDYPDSFLYDAEGGTWAVREGSGFRLGVAPHLSWLSGGFTSVSVKPSGSRVEMGKTLGSVDGPKHFDVVRAPFDCVVTAVNPRLASEPRLANKDPFGEGWLAVVEQTGRESKLAPIGEAGASITETVGRLGIHCFAEFPDVEMYQMGVECSAVLVGLGEVMERSPPGTVVHVVSDDQASGSEMKRWQEQTGNLVVDATTEGRLRHFIVKKKG